MLNFTKHLPEFGWIPVVLCGKQSLIEAVDQSSLDVLPSSIRIHRMFTLENFLIDFLARKNFLSAPKATNGKSYCTGHKGFSLETPFTTFVRRIRCLPARKIGLIPFSLFKALRILESEDIEVIMSRSGAINTHILALILKSLTRKHWIASFSDPWTTDPNLPYQKKLLPAKLIKWYDELLEKLVILNADRIVLTTERLKAEYVNRFEPIREEKFVVIPNCCEPPANLPDKNTVHSRKKFTMTYCGNFANLRSPEPLFKALSLLKNEGDVLTRMQVRIIGRLGNFEYLISKYGLCEVVKVIDPVPHKYVFHFLNDSDILLLVDAPNHDMCLASKLVEYLFVGKPILAITSNNGEAAKVVKATKTGVVVSPENIEEIRSAIKQAFRNYSHGALSIDPDWTEINKYNANSCTAKIVRVIEDVFD